MKLKNKKLFFVTVLLVMILSFNCVSVFATNKKADSKVNNEISEKKDSKKDNVKDESNIDNKKVKKSDIEKDADKLINDAADILTDSQEDELKKIMESVMKKHDIDFRLVIANGIAGDKNVFSNDDMSKYTQDYYKKHNIGKGDKKDGIVFILGCDIRKYYAWYEGKAGKLVNKKASDELSTIFEKKIKGKENISNKDFYNSIKDYVDSVEDEISSCRNKRILIAAGIALVVAGIIIFIFICQLSNARPKESAGDYVKEGSFVVTGRQDIFLHTTETRRKIERSSSSGGHHSSSSSSGHGSGGSF